MKQSPGDSVLVASTDGHFDSGTVMEMGMRAKENIEMGQDITPPLRPLAFSLYDSFLSSHCSSCFSPLPPDRPSFPPSFLSHSHHVPSLFYCSSSCSLSDSPLHLSSAEFHFLQSFPAASCSELSSDIRAALRLLLSLRPTSLRSGRPYRIGGLLTNCDRLMSKQSDVSARIREGAVAMALARRRAGGDVEALNQGDFALEEVMLCMVITNAVEVQDNFGRSLGIAVYDVSFSWINHSCSPNACYRFVISSSDMAPFPDDCGRLHILPHAAERDKAEGESDVGSNVEVQQGNHQGHGPRMVVGSIKRINKGEEVSVSYTDLLQPKAMRQSELWSKYQFLCCCRRCNASPPTYVDHALEGIYATKAGFTSNVSDDNNEDEVTGKMTDYMDETISEYLSVGDPESWCEKLEYVLSHGLLSEQLGMKEGKSQLKYRLHPLHHLALNAYTTLASAYKVRSMDSVALCSEIVGDQLEAFDMSRASAAYSLLLAGAAYHLFNSESSLITSAANFWVSAGESLLTLARSSVWGLLEKHGLPNYFSSLARHKCTKCSLMELFEASLSLRQTQNADFEEISSKFHDCVTNMAQEVWIFLAQGCSYLQVFKDPIDFSWLGKSTNEWDFQGHCTNEDSSHGAEESTSRHEAQGYTIEGRLNIFQLGVHCLLYGRFLANICYGENSHLANHIQSILYDAENLAY